MGVTELDFSMNPQKPISFFFQRVERFLHTKADFMSQRKTHSDKILTILYQRDLHYFFYSSQTKHANDKYKKITQDHSSFPRQTKQPRQFACKMEAKTFKKKTSSF